MAHQILLTTTGNLPNITINDLGGRSFTHPTTNYNLLNEYRIEQIRESLDLQTFVTNGNITLLDDNNVLLTNVSNQTFPVITNVQQSNARTIGLTVDGVGLPISTGFKGYIVAGFNGTINGWDMIADQIGSIQIDIWNSDTWGTNGVAIPTSLNSIVNGNYPSLVANQYNSSNSVGTWMQNVKIGDIIGFNVNSSSTVTKIFFNMRIISH